ncbi:MAG: MipA/OmpV family protein [Gammaproteobacteria bacterium]|nr:MipA/OmpV family protein [Gammaproteobacteria bacterium]
MRWKTIFAVPLFALSLQNVMAAYQSPVWELGVASGYLRTPEYRGAAQNHQYFIPFPYAAYRGHRLRIDEDGIRSLIVNTTRWKLDMRFGGNVPVKSKDTSKRTGMNKLAPVIELGPSLEYFLWQDNRPNGDDIWLRMPLRLMNSVGKNGVGYQGFSFAPYLEYVKRWRKTNIIWNCGVAIGPLFNSADYNNYFYQVSMEDSTNSRPAYNASMGYSGSRITLTLIGNSKHLWYGMFARYDNMQGATFINSPLIETDHYTALGVSIGWKFLKSDAHSK